MRARVIVTAGVLLACVQQDRAADPATRVPQWTVSPEPMFVAGGDADAEPLFRVTGAVRVSNGYLIVNASAGEIRLYGDDGRLLGMLGTEGSGPGEFLAPRLPGRLGGDSVVVADDGNRKIVIICEGMRVCDEWALPAAGNVIGVAGDHVLLGEIMPATSTDELSYDRHRFFATTRRGSELDTLFEFDATPRIARRIDGRLISMPMLFSRPSSVTLVPEGIALTNGRDAVVTIVDTAGTVVADIRLPVAVAAVSQEEFDGEIDRRLAAMDPARRETFAEFYDRMPRPDYRSPIQRILADRLGLIWVELDGLSGEQEWLVVDASGRVVARAITPADLLITEIGEDYVVALWRDTRDVEFVLAYRLDRGR